MLTAPEAATPLIRPGTAVASANWRDVPRIAVSRALATSRYRSTVLVYGSMPCTVLQVFAQIGRAEVWVTGGGTSVVMTQTRSRRRPSRSDALSITVFFVAIVALGVAAGAATWRGGISGALTLALLIVAGTAVLAPPLALAAVSRRRQGVALARPGTSGRVIRLHDLVRHPADPAGTGTALLRQVITHSRYSADTVVAVAATPRLADLYSTTGLTRITDAEKL